MTLNELTEALKNAGVDNAAYDARELFYAFGGFDRRFPLGQNAASESKSLIQAAERRIAREPLQYIIGEVGFYREVYRVTPDCLIPRCDTEILVDEAVKRLPHGAKFIDLCCGSGCVGISVLRNTDARFCTAVDVSDGAVKLAEENAARNGVSDRYSVISLDVISDGAAERITCGEQIDAILSNPPYVARKVYESLAEEIFKEPEIAFVGGEDGGDFYRKMTPMYLDFLKEDGFIAYEIGFDQAGLIKEIAEKNGCKAEIIKDYSGCDRVAILKKHK